MSRSALFAAHDAATGALSWTLDLSAVYPDSTWPLRGVADLGSGELAFALRTENAGASGLYLVEAATGALAWSSVLPSGAAYSVLGSDGAGSMLVTSGFTSSYPPYQTAADVSEIDGVGRLVWTEHIANGPPETALFAWPSGVPWLGVAGTQGISRNPRYLATPSSWYAAVTGSDFGFVFDYGEPIALDGTNSLGVHAVRSGAVVAEGTIPDTSTNDGTAVWPFLAGDHVVLVAQRYYGNPGLCHPDRAADASISRIDASSSWTCPLPFQGESAISGAALLPGLLVIGRRTYLTDGCTDQLQPVTIEAYALPGESLSTSGWVQNGGSPGLGMRPIKP